MLALNELGHVALSLLALGGFVGIHRFLGYAPAADVEPAVSLHGQLHAAFVADGLFQGGRSDGCAIDTDGVAGVSGQVDAGTLAHLIEVGGGRA